MLLLSRSWSCNFSTYSSKSWITHQHPTIYLTPHLSLTSRGIFLPLSLTIYHCRHHHHHYCHHHPVYAVTCVCMYIVCAGTPVPGHKLGFERTSLRSQVFHLTFLHFHTFWGSTSKQQTGLASTAPCWDVSASPSQQFSFSAQMMLHWLCVPN